MCNPISGEDWAMRRNADALQTRHVWQIKAEERERAKVKRQQKVKWNKHRGKILPVLHARPKKVLTLTRESAKWHEITQLQTLQVKRAAGQNRMLQRQPKWLSSSTDADAVAVAASQF